MKVLKKGIHNMLMSKFFVCQYIRTSFPIRNHLNKKRKELKFYPLCGFASVFFMFATIFQSKPVDTGTKPHRQTHINTNIHTQTHTDTQMRKIKLQKVSPCFLNTSGL